MVRRVVVAGLLLACGCNQIFGLEAPGDDDDLPGDGGGADGGWDGGVGGWTGKAKIPIASSLDVTEEDPAITPDGTQLYFGAFAAGDIKDLWVSNRGSGDQWETATRSSLSDAGIDGSPRFRVGEPGAGLEIYFSSDRVGGQLDIFSAVSVDDVTWSIPAPVAALNALEEDSAAAPCDEPGRFVVASRRGGASSDLYEIVAGNAVLYIEQANTGSNETGPFLTRDCRRLYYGSNSRGTFDLYVVSRPAVDQPWGPAEMLTDLSTSFDEGDPWVSDDERHILYTSNVAGDFDLYEAFR